MPLMSHPPPKLIPLLHKLKDVYLVWFGFYSELPKPHRYTLGLRVDDMMVEAIEIVTVASYSPKQDTVPILMQAIRKIDTITVMLLLLKETQLLEEKRYVTISIQLNTIGQMLGAWRNRMLTPNTNSSSLKPEES